LWYRLVQIVSILVFLVQGGVRATGREHVPRDGGVLLVANHLSFLDVFVLGLLLRRPLNYVARSSLFFPPLGWLIRSVGAFPIEREGVGKQGLVETLRRLQAGGIVTLFPEGTRSPDGELQPLKPGIAVLVSRARVPVVPVGIAGTFEAWSRHRRWPRPHPMRVHYAPPIFPADLGGLDRSAITALIHDRMAAAVSEARRRLARDLSRNPIDDRDDRPASEGPIADPRTEQTFLRY
jgi:1-acyl-sn-glycerol-3-phosphate acyltransferase